MNAPSSRTPSGHAPIAPPPLRTSRPRSGFTLVELLLSMTILSVLMLVVVNVIGVVQQQWIRSNSRVTAFREARMALDIIAKNLSQATLNPYWMTKNNPLAPSPLLNQARFKAESYVRQSELQFCCGPTTGLLGDAAGRGAAFPGHAVFFQAPLGTARLANANGGFVNTENMVNMLAARGYFVAWGDDANFRPPFLANVATIRPRFRYRLMEYSPTAESNRIYYDPLNSTNIENRRPITDPDRSREWFSDAMRSPASAGEDGGSRGFTRPVADNIIALVLSPQLAQTRLGGSPEDIAPMYTYDSAMIANPGAGLIGVGPQGTQHLLPPLIKVTMVALDSAAGEKLAEGGNEAQQGRLAATLNPLFTNARGYNSANSPYNVDLSNLQNTLVAEKLNFRVFTTTVVMRGSRIK